MSLSPCVLQLLLATNVDDEFDILLFSTQMLCRLNSYNYNTDRFLSRKTLAEQAQSASKRHKSTTCNQCDPTIRTKYQSTQASMDSLGHRSIQMRTVQPAMCPKGTSSLPSTGAHIDSKEPGSLLHQLHPVTTATHLHRQLMALRLFRLALRRAIVIAS